jgi:hypothetical protein
MTEPSDTAIATAGDEPPATPSSDVSLLLKVLQSLVGPSVVLFVAVTEGVSVVEAAHVEAGELPEMLVPTLESQVHAWLADTDEVGGYQASTTAPDW